MNGVSRDRAIQGGEPCLSGTRMPTRAVWEFHLTGRNLWEIRDEYPHLTISQIHTAIVYENRWQRRLGRWWQLKKCVVVERLSWWCGCG